MATGFRQLATILLLAASMIGVSKAQPVTQPFTFSLHPHTIPPVQHGVATWGDYDGDGDQDVFISGIAEAGILTELYRNDGKQPGAMSDVADSVVVFTLVDAEFADVSYSSAAWGDFDNDGDLDLVVQGSLSREHPYDPVTILYENVGGDFFEVDEAELIDLHSGAVSWADVDNDGDQDLLIVGEDAEGRRHTLLYRNQSGRRFDVIDTGIIGVAYGDAAWSDYDNDGDLDLAIGGITDSGFRTVVYTNEGAAFEERASLASSSGFASIDWGDFDDDGDPDLLVAGSRIAPFVLEGETSLYRNDNGSFNSVDVDFAGSFAGSARWGDYDNDGDLDVFILGAEEVFGDRTARLYANEDGTFRLTTYLVGSLFAAADWGDFEGDGDLDLLTTGLTSGGPSITNLYENRRQVIPPPALAPTATGTQVEGGDVWFHWEPTVHVPAASYNLRVGTTSGAGDVLSPLVEEETGKRLISRPGNVGTSGRWVLRNLPEGTYYWSVQTLNGAMRASSFAGEQSFHIDRTATAAQTDGTPDAFVVHPNFPNPFSRSTSLKVELPESSRLTVQVFDALGKSVALLVDDVRAAGTHVISWTGRDGGGQLIPSGIYFYRLEAGSRIRTGRMVFIPTR